MNESAHLEARLVSMARRQDRLETHLDTLEELARSTDRKLDVATTDVGQRREHLDDWLRRIEGRMDSSDKRLEALATLQAETNRLIDRAMWTVKVVRWGAAAVAAAGAAWASTISDVRAWFGK